MTTSVIDFTAQCLAFGATFRASTIDIVAAYVQFNNGSTTGKMKLYAHLKTIQGVSKNGTTYTGLKLKQTEKAAPAPTPATTPALVPAPTMDAYQTEMLKLKQQKVQMQKEREERQAKEQKEREERQAKQAAEFKLRDEALAKELKGMDIKMKQMEVESQATLKQMDLEDKEKDRQFYREENNKNRKMTSMVGYNKYLDMMVYGTPSQQFVDCHSFIENASFQAFKQIGSIDTSVEESIASIARHAAKVVPIVEHGTTKDIEAIDVEEVMTVVAAIEERNEPVKKALTKLTDKASTIAEIAVSDQSRMIDSEYTVKLSKQNPEKHKTMKSKFDYIKQVNDDNSLITIKCGCCRKQINIKDNECHRCHDVPRSQGGDCSVDNIFLCCSGCNLNMGDEMSVEDYITVLYIKAKQAMQKIEAENVPSVACPVMPMIGVAA